MEGRKEDPAEARAPSFTESPSWPVVPTSLGAATNADRLNGSHGGHRGAWRCVVSGLCFKEQDKRGLESSAQFTPLTGGWRVNGGRSCVGCTLGVRPPAPGTVAESCIAAWVPHTSRLPQLGLFRRRPGWFVSWGLGFRPEAPCGDHGWEPTDTKQGLDVCVEFEAF